MNDDQNANRLDLTQWTELGRECPRAESLPGLSAKIPSLSGEMEIVSRLTAQTAPTSAVR